MHAADWEPVEAAARRVLADLDVLVASAATAVRQRVPEYTYVTDDELLRALRRNTSILVSCLRERRVVSEQELTYFADTVQNRARAGVPLDEYLLAVSTAEAECWAWLLREAPDLPSALLIELYALRFQAMELVTRETATAHTRVELQLARESHERATGMLRTLLTEPLDDQSLREHAGVLGLALDRSYYAVTARPLLEPEDLTQRLAGDRNRPPFARLINWGDDVVGLMLEIPVPGQQWVAGLGGPVPLQQAARAHAEAQLAFATAWALRLPGAHTLSELGLLSTTFANPGVGALLRARFVTPLGTSGTLGEELLTTVRAYLEGGSRREVAAERVHVHVNTVRYRLARFTELTGADLEDLRTLAELWWLFTDMDLRGSSLQPRNDESAPRVL